MKQLKKPYLPPRAIFNQHSKFLESEFIAFSKKLNNRIKPILDLDYSQIKIELEKIQSEYKLWIDQKKLLKGIERNYKLINAWVESKLGRQDSSPKNKTKQDAASPTPEYLQNELYAEHWEKVKNVIRDGVVSKKPANEIYNEILKTTDMNKARAKFWAEDQIAQFEAEKRRLLSIREGFTHYRWVILGKNTRDTHRANFGKIFSWNVGAGNLTRPGARHPGEDYRCHCFTENLTEEEANKLGYTVEPPRQPASIEQLVENYYGKVEYTSSEKAGFVSKEKFESMKAVSVSIIENELDIKVESDNIRLMTLEEMEIYEHGAVHINGQILIRPDDPRIDISILHEIAHWVDGNIIGVISAKGSSMEGFQILINEMGNIPRMNPLFERLKKSTDKIIRDLTGKNEIFARLIEQYLVSRNVNLKESFSIKRKVFKYTGKDVYLTDKEFNKILPLLENYLRLVKLL